MPRICRVLLPPSAYVTLIHIGWERRRQNIFPSPRATQFLPKSYTAVRKNKFGGGDVLLYRLLPPPPVSVGPIQGGLAEVKRYMSFITDTIFIDTFSVMTIMRNTVYHIFFLSSVTSGYSCCPDTSGLVKPRQESRS